ncbi:MAG: DUF5667 domain-containing protein, partial [Patescibacteria group bacterium]|nr:DUF5667 domain-containing protein [Patescibacteria group bacterium]
MQNIIKQLNKLDKIQPSTQWKEKTKKELLARIANEESPRRFNRWAEFLYLTKSFFSDMASFAREPIGTLIIVFLLVCGGGVMKVKADSSMPGDFLYSLKRGSEKLQIALVVDQGKKSDLRLEMIDKRIQELNNAVSIERDDRIKLALENFHKDFTHVEKNVNPEAAKNIEDKTDDFHTVLNKTEKKLAKRGARTDIKKAIEVVDKANFSALEIMAADGEDAEVAEKVGVKIDKAVQKAEEKGESGEEALAKLEDAKENLAGNRLVAALIMVKESEDILDDNIENTDDCEGDVCEIEIDKAATTTDKTVITTEEELEQKATTTDGKVLREEVKA